MSDATDKKGVSSRASFASKLVLLAGYFPLTAAGLTLALGLMAAVQFRGLEDLDMVALAAGSGLLIVLALAVISVVVGSYVTKNKLLQEEQPTFLELASGKSVRSGFSLKLWSYLPLIHLSWTILEFEADVAVVAQGDQLREELTCHRRGLRTGLTRRFTVSDTLGLSAISWNEKSSGRVRVLPNPGRLDQPNILLSLASGEDLSDPRGKPDGDRVDMRQYQKGDPMKFILWKVYSRSGKVMVRVPERALAARPRACCYLMSGPNDEASAALARVLLESRMLGPEWRFGADGQMGFANQVNEALDLVALSGNVSQSRSQGLKLFLEQAELDGYGFCLVLAPPGSKGLANQVISTLDRSSLRSDIWVGLDYQPKEAASWFGGLQILESKPLSPRVIRQQWGGQSTLVDRNSGRVLARAAGTIG